MKSKISHQLILAVAVISLGIFGLLSHFLIGSHHRSMIDLLEQHANQYTETIKSATRYAMLHDRRDDVHRIIDSIGEQEGILRVCIFNKEGKIIYSPDRASQGTMVDKRAEGLLRMPHCRSTSGAIVDSQPHKSLHRRRRPIHPRHHQPDLQRAHLRPGRLPRPSREPDRARGPRCQHLARGAPAAPGW